MSVKNCDNVKKCEDILAINIKNEANIENMFITL